MRKRVRTIAAVAGVLLVIVAAVLVWTHRAVHHVPAFYQQALVTDRQAQERGSNEFLQQAASLASEAPKSGSWHAVFTQDQINGWLAVDLKKNHPGLLPSGVSDPRVQVAATGLTLACQYDSGRISTVFSLEVQAYLAEPNVIALRIQRARAGSIPLPLDQVLQGFTKAADRAGLQLAWKQTEGDPVALVTLPALISDDRLLLKLETLELRDGELHVAGKTEPATPLVASNFPLRRPAAGSTKIPN